MIDIDRVDKVFATAVRDKKTDAPQIRIDADGRAARSTMRDLAEADDNVNSSLWLTIPDALELRDRLDDAISEARD